MKDFPLELIDDESIIASTPYANQFFQEKLPGHIAQQIVKSEFWRMNFSPAYLCLDSDAIFIRDIQRADYLVENGCTYTVMDEGQEFLQSSLESGKTQRIVNFHKEAARVQVAFDRVGKAYSFGPFPNPWHRAVWESLERQYLQPRGMTFLDAIKQAPLESRWYGEALLAFRAIPLMPCQPLFKVYHYARDLDRDRRKGVTEERLAHLYAGVIYQSAWEREMDWPSEGGNFWSRAGRRLRRWAGRI